MSASRNNQTANLLAMPTESSMTGGMIIMMSIIMMRTSCEGGR